MTVSVGDAAGGGCHFYLVCSAGDDAVTGLQAFEYLYFFAVVGSDGDFLFAVSFFVELYVDVVLSHFVCECCYGQREYVVYGLGEEVYFDE